MDIKSIDDITIDSILIDKDSNQEVTILKISKIGDVSYKIGDESLFLSEALITVMEKKDERWFILDVECAKCKSKSKLKYTSTTQDKFKCVNNIKIDVGGVDKYVNCGSKQFDAISKKYTGINVKNSYSFKALCEKFKLK